VTWRLYNTDGTPLPHDECPMAVALKEGRPVRGAEAVAERPNGEQVPFIPYPTPLHDASGKMIGAVNMLVDITERKQSEARQKRLIDELNHRVKNTLATVQSLARQTLRGTDCPEAVCDDFEARLFALSQVHDQLTREAWQGADLRSILAATFAPYQICPGDRAHVEGPSVRLGPQAAVALTMVFHELATNAVKYGALSVPSGQVAVSWSLARGEDGPNLKIDWQESGGPAVREPVRRGFGSRLLERAVARGLKGSAAMAFEPCGLRCRMEIPLSYANG
jgi:two-component sensor histidine kinase